MSKERVPNHDHSGFNEGGKLALNRILSTEEAGSVSAGGTAGGSATVIVEEGGSVVVAAAAALNAGHGLDATDEGGGVAGVAVDEAELDHDAIGGTITHAGDSLSPGTLVIPGATSPAQTAEGSAVWDTDDDTLTVGTGAARKEFGYLGSSAPSGGYGTAASGSSKEVLRKDAVLAKPTAADVDFSADVTTSDATSGHHGLLPKLSGDSTKFLDGSGNFSALNISGATLAAGTSFPGSPSTNDLFYRTDLGFLFFYNGTRWLSADTFVMQWGFGTSNSFGATTTSLAPPVPPLTGGSDLWLVSASVQFFINSGGSALSGSHKWVCVLNKRPTGNTQTAVSTFNIDSGSSGAWRTLENSIGALLNNGTTHYTFDMTFTKTGTPGNFNGGYSIIYRLVAT